MTTVAVARSAKGAGRPAAIKDLAAPDEGASVLARISALTTMDISELRANWRELMSSEPPVYNRRFLETRLAYRIQELAFGGLKPSTLARIESLIADSQAGQQGSRRPLEDRPVTGTQLIREWQGVEHCATVTAGGYEYAGRPYKSISAVARAITGTRWNGWLFFGLKRSK